VNLPTLRYTPNRSSLERHSLSEAFILLASEIVHTQIELPMISLQFSFHKRNSTKQTSSKLCPIARSHIDLLRTHKKITKRVFDTKIRLITWYNIIKPRGIVPKVLPSSTITLERLRPIIIGCL
jgi:hypothetical protein